MSEEYTYELDKYIILVDKSNAYFSSATLLIKKDSNTYVVGNFIGEQAKYIDLLIRNNFKLKEKLKQKQNIVNKLKDLLYDEFLEVIDRNDLLKILDNKGEYLV